jgi:glutaredoxin
VRADLAQQGFNEVGNAEFVLVVTQNGCAACKKLKDLLAAKDVPYFEVDYFDISESVKRMIVDTRKKYKVDKIGLPFWFYGDFMYTGLPSELELDNIVRGW